ncbi:MAG: hypothetical protein UV28_C0037G0005 [Candidatus Collierbacteria bacterium GW2011_GWE2_42_48]|nr:MAG: hypothetical protein UV28_C0037G0005 [Candidatus Collierbacteria bacterium GW2011_GWE2_42_48]
MPQEENIITSVKNIYDNIGKEFSSSRQYIWPDLKPYLKNVKSGSSVLDKYTGLDISKELLKEAERAHPEHKFYETDITKESLWKHLPQYDYIFCIAVFHHLPTKKDQLFVLNQIKRHLKPRGKILITAWNLWQPKYLKYHFDLKTKLQNPHFVYIPFQGKPRFCFAMTTPYLKKLLESVNLKLKVKKSPHNYILN